MIQELESTVDAGRVRKSVEELAHLSRSDIPADQFLRRFVSLAVPVVRARGMAVWFPNGQELHIAAGAGVEESGYHADPRQKNAVQAIVREVVETKQLLVIGAGNAEGAQPNGKYLNFKPFPFVYAPILAGEGTSDASLLAVMQFWLPTGFDPRAFREVVAGGQSLAREAAVFLRARRVESLATGQIRLQKMIVFVTEMSGQHEVKRLGAILVNWARDISGADRCVFFAADFAGKLEPVAVSNVELVNPKSALVQLQLKLAREAIDSEKPMLFQKSAPNAELEGKLSDYFVLSQSTDALAVPIRDEHSRPLGLLLIESHKDQGLTQEAQNAAIAVARHAAKPLGAALEIQRLPMLKPMRKLAALRARLTSTRPRTLMLKYGLPFIVAVVIACFPVRMVVRNDCIVVPKVRGVAVAQVSGRVKQIFVKEGDAVTAGQPLAKIDEADLQQSLRLSEEEQQRYEIEANRAEAAGDEASRQIAMVEVTRAGRQVELYKTEIERTWIRCPIGGVVLTKDIETLTGSLVAAGTRFCDIGDFQRWQVVSKVSESEIGLLETKLRRGPIAMKFVLNSAPGRNIDAVIPNEQAISPISSVVPGANVFLVRADFQEQPDQLSALKAGYSGRSKIPLDHCPAIYLALRKFINYLRVRWFF